MTLARSAIQLQASKLLQTGLALVASIVFARGAGPSALGGYAALISFAVLMQGLTSLGFEDLVLARGPLAGSDTDRARSLYRKVLRIRGVVYVVLGVATVAAFAGAIPDPFSGTSTAAFGFAFAYAALNGIATLGATIQAARVKPAVSAALDSLWSLGVAVTYVTLLVVHTLTLTSAIVTIAVWQAAIDIGYAFVLLPLALDASLKSGSAVFRGRESFGFWLNGLLSIGIGKNSDVLAMNVAGAPSAAVGRYNAAYNANLTAGSLLLQGTGTMLYVGLGRAFSDGSRDRLAAGWRTATVMGALFSTPLLIYCVIFPRGILVALYGPAYASGAGALMALAATGIVVRGLGGGSNQSVLFLANRQNQVLAVRGLCVTLNVALDIVLFHALGIVGVAVASGGCGVMVTAIELLLSRGVAPIRVPWSSMARIALPYAATGLVMRLLLGDGGELASFAVSVGVVFTAGTLMLMLTRPLRASEIPDAAPLALKRVLRRIAIRPPAAPAH